MLHPRLTPLDGSRSQFLAEIGDYGSWSDLTWTTRYGSGACGMYEVSWTMPLPPDFDHPLLRRGTIVELMDGPYRVGSPLILSQPGRGAGFDQPWTLTATGVGREVEGASSWYCDDGAGNTTTVASDAIDSAIANGLPWVGYDATVPTFAFGDADSLQTIGSLLTSIGDAVGQRWGVDRDSIVGFKSDPTEPAYHVTPGAALLGTADDDYASVVKVRYADDVTHALATAVAPASPSAVELRFGRREFPVDVTSLGEIPAATAQGFADGILAKSKGRLAWTNGLTLTSNELLTSGGVPANLTKAAEDVGTGCMVRLHGVWGDLLESTGQTWLDVIIGEAKPSPDGQTIDLNPLGLAPRDLAAVVESVTGMAAA